MKKTVLGILLLCTLLLIRPATALASGPCCNFCGRDVTFVKLKPYPRYHELIYWCDACKMNTRLDVSHTGGTATCTERAVCEVCNEPYGELAAHTGGTATCTERAVCEVCNQPYGEPPAHTGGTGTFTCTTGKICEKCGVEYGILGHAWYWWGEWISAGNGTHTRRCTRCNTVETADCIGGTATCTAKAVCVKCGKPYGDLAPHQLKTFKRPATCRQEGLEYTRCTAEGCNYRTPDIITPKQHDLKKAQEFTRKPTCTKPGWNSYYLCRDCAYSETDWIDKLGHDPILHEAKVPTCTEKGWNAYETCSRCNHTTYTELPALNHDLEQHDAKAPTCTEIGWDAYETCSRCNHTTRTELPALNHDLEQHEAKAPTCTEKGWNAYETCSRCNHTTRTELPALNHDLEQHEAKAPTCTEKGWNAYETCSRCNHTTRTELPALNHDLEQHAAKAPTCTEIGWDAYDTCSRCDYTTYVELPALNHDYQAVTVDPTCEADGYTVFTCSRCKDSYTADPTDKLGHKFGAWSPNGTGSQSAGCLRQGCAHIGITDCRKFTFRTAEGETLTFCPVCGQAENAAQLEKIEAATAWPLSGSLSAEDVTARTNGEYLSVAFETAGSLTQPTGRVRLALPAGLLEGKTLVRIAPDGTQTELPFEAKNGRLIFTLDFANSELPVMLFRLVPQTTVL